MGAPPLAVGSDSSTNFSRAPRQAEPVEAYVNEPVMDVRCQTTLRQAQGDDSDQVGYPMEMTHTRRRSGSEGVNDDRETRPAFRLNRCRVSRPLSADLEPDLRIYMGALPAQHFRVDAEMY